MNINDARFLPLKTHHLAEKVIEECYYSAYARMQGCAALKAESSTEFKICNTFIDSDGIILLKHISGEIFSKDIISNTRGFTDFFPVFVDTDGECYPLYHLYIGHRYSNRIDKDIFECLDLMTLSAFLDYLNIPSILDYFSTNSNYISNCIHSISYTIYCFKFNHKKTYFSPESTDFYFYENIQEYDFLFYSMLNIGKNILGKVEL